MSELERDPRRRTLRSVDHFARLVRSYERWLLSGKDEGADAARSCLLHLSELYRAALEIPAELSHETEPAIETRRVSQQEWQLAFEAAGRLPIDLYADVFDPTELPAEDTITGSLLDDLADLYRDLVDGLRADEQGDRAGAVWQWSFCFQHHWGAHAVGALRCLHAWLAGNAPDRLSGSPL